MSVEDEYPDWLPPHKCNIWNWCILDNDYKLFSCVICHKVVAFEDSTGKRTVKPNILDKEHKQYEQKEFSDDILRDSV